MKLKITRPTPAEVEAEKPKVCSACNGSGYYDWSDPKTGYQPKCDACEGTGLADA